MVMDLGSKAVCMCGMRPRPSAINPEKHRVPREPADCWLDGQDTAERLE